MRHPIVLSSLAALLIFAAAPMNAQQSKTVGQLSELTAADGIAGDQFGYSAAIDGKMLVVGAPMVAKGDGAAYVFIGSVSGWTQAAKLTPSDGGGSFGNSVGIAGNTVVIGAPRHPSNDRGAVYVFVEPEGGWRDMTETAELTVTNQPVTALGASVAIGNGGATVVTGTGGAAYVFREPASGWTSLSKPTASLVTPPAAGFFGISIAISGNTVVVGSPFGGPAAAYIFLLATGQKKIQPTATLTPSDATGDSFGGSVGISDNTVVVGAADQNSAGAAYVFVKPAGGWTDTTQTAELSVVTTQDIALGGSVAIFGDVTLAGAPADFIGHSPLQGAVFGYLQPPGGWVNTSTPKGSFTGSDSAARDEFGFSVALTGVTAVIGAPFHAVNGKPTQGAAYVFGQR
jgi:hypothetical protein